MDWLAREEHSEDDDDAVAQFLRLLDDLLIFTPSTVFEKPSPRQQQPCREDFSGVAEREVFVRMVGILRRYVRPRKQVERIRRAVNAALQEQRESLSTLDNVYGRYSRAKADVELLRAEKAELRGRLAGIKRRRPSMSDIQIVLLGKPVLDKARTEVDILRIYKDHLNILLDSPEKVDNQTTLVIPSLSRPFQRKLEPNTRIIRPAETINFLKARVLLTLGTRTPSEAIVLVDNPLQILKAKTYPPIPRVYNVAHNSIPK